MKEDTYNNKASFWLVNFKSYIHLHRQMLYNIYEHIILKTDGNLFCKLFNFVSLIRGRNVKLKYDSTKRKYYAHSKDYNLSSYHKKQANTTYSRGFKSRATFLGNIYFLPLINFKSGDLVVDCGANVGDLKLYFTENKIPIEYIGIEPSPLEYECLSENVAPSKTLNIGLWNTDSSLEFYISSQGADSSFIKPPTYDDIINIPTKRLDNIITNKIKLLKLEAEGAEPEVIQGCENILDNIEYISADIGPERGVEQRSTLAPVTNYLLSKNFELVEVSFNRVVALFHNKKYNSN